MTEAANEIDKKWWNLFKEDKENKKSKPKSSENKEPPVAEKPAEKISMEKVDDEKIVQEEPAEVLARFEYEVKKLEKTRKELMESIPEIIPALEEHKKKLQDEIDARSKRIVEIDKQIEAIKNWIKKHRDLMETEELKIQFQTNTERS